MNKHLWKIPLGLVLLGGLLLVVAVACTSAKPTPTTAASVAAVHQKLEAKTDKPKRLEAVIEIDMREFHFDNPQGEKNPIFRLPAGKTVGIHVHNEGAVTHELAIGRKLDASTGEYTDELFHMVSSDLFFYYGKEKAEVEGAEFGEMEVTPSVKDIWIRMTFPEKLKGEWEIGCLIKEDKDHYAEGMHAKLIIE